MAKLMKEGGEVGLLQKQESSTTRKSSKEHPWPSQIELSPQLED